jgi:hypothetical protein
MQSRSSAKTRKQRSTRPRPSAKPTTRLGAKHLDLIQDDQDERLPAELLARDADEEECGTDEEALTEERALLEWADEDDTGTEAEVAELLIREAELLARDSDEELLRTTDDEAELLG